MAGAVVQSKTAVANTATSPASITLNTAATAGNTLVVIYGGDDYVTSGNRPTGFSEPTGGRQETFLGHYVWYKVAAGGETTFTATPGSAVPWVMIVLELSGVGALDVSNGTLVSSGGNTFATPTVTPTAGPRYAVASIGGSLNTNFNTGMGAWTNSFVEAADIATTLGAGTRDNIAAATLPFTATGSSTIDTTATWDAAISPQARTGIILVFAEAAAGTNAPATEATSAGAAQTPAVAIAPTGIEAVGAGSAPSPTAAVAVNAVEAVATGTALAAVPAAGAAPAAATAAGTAEWSAGSAISLDLTADNPVDGVGTAYDATVSTASALAANATEATAAGAAQNPTVSAGPGATEAIGAGVAQSPTVSTSSPTNAPATEAVAAGVALDATVAVETIPALATAAGQAQDPTVSTLSAVNPDAGLATATGTALDVSATVQVFAGTATAAGAAVDPAVLIGGPGSAFAGVATAVGEALNARPLKLTLRPFAGTTTRPYAGITPRP